MISILFEYPCDRSTSVEIAGSFNNWEKIPMVRENNKWVKRISLFPGTHQYKYITNGVNWIHDKNLPTVSDNHGGSNNRLLIQPHETWFDQHMHRKRRYS